MSLNEQQQRAVYNHQQNVVLSAGAGAGKTHVLVERFLALLAQKYPQAQGAWRLNNLVAVTFTNAAAAEMKERVRQRLLDVLNDSASPEPLRGAYRDALGKMDSARIDTIHGLCTLLLRQNAAQAQLDPAFVVLDEAQALLLRRRALDEVLRAVQDDAVPEQALIFSLFNDYDAQTVSETITQPSLLRHSLRLAPSFEAHMAELRTAQAEVALQFARSLLSPEDERALFALEVPAKGGVLAENLQLLRDLVREIQQFLRAIPTTNKGLESGIAESGIENADTSADAFNAEHLCLLLEQVSRLGMSTPKGEWVEEAKRLIITARDVVKVNSKLHPLLQPLNEAVEERAYRALQAWASLHGQVRQRYSELKQAQAALDFDDLEQRTLEILRLPEVRARYQGQEFKQLLVDEFQDTNDDQWQIVQALADLSTGGALFVVGDEKQSIYGFRGADVSVFKQVQTQVQAQAGALLPLNVSFRTHPHLITIFNRLFERVFAHRLTPLAQDYDVEMSALSAHRPAEGDYAIGYAPLELLLLDKAKVPKRRNKPDADALKQWEAECVAERLYRLKQSKASVHDKRTGAYRAFEYGDAAILMRSLTQVKRYEDALRARGIPFVTLAGRGYYNRPEVWDMLNLLKALYIPSDDLALAAVLRSPIFGLSDVVLLALRRLTSEADVRTPLPLRHALSRVQADPTLLSTLLSDEQDFQRLVRAEHILTALSALVGRVSVAELLQEALSRTHYLAILTGLPNGGRLRGNVEKLVTIARDSQTVTLGAFLDYVQAVGNQAELRESEADEDVQGVVRLMSIHASKGLEFPVVVLANMGSKAGGVDSAALRHQAGVAWGCKVPLLDGEAEAPRAFAYELLGRLDSAKERAEDKRLLYVALTRARDAVILSGVCEPDSKTDKLKANGWLGDFLNQDWLELSTADEQGRIAYAEYAHQKIYIQATQPDYQAQNRPRPVIRTGWNRPALPASVPQAPPLLAPLPRLTSDMLRHLSATQLAHLGGWRYDERARDYHRRSLRQGALDDMPALIETVYPAVQSQRVSARRIGTMVHEALRHWRTGRTPEQQKALLQGYAWQVGLSDADDIAHAVARAERLLDAFKQSALCAEIDSARQVYRELPFILRTEKRILHGAMDVLYQTQAGEWVIVDYKTGFVPDASAQALDQHARQYYLQVGAYASAVRQQLQQATGIAHTPHTRIHHIRYQHTTHIPSAAWEAELRSLEDLIGAVVQ